MQVERLHSRRDCSSPRLVSMWNVKTAERHDAEGRLHPLQIPPYVEQHAAFHVPLHTCCSPIKLPAASNT